MTRGEAIKDFFCKTILPVAAAALLYCIFRSACVKTVSWTTYGYGYSAGCRSASGGCASGSYRAAALWAAGSRCSR